MQSLNQINFQFTIKTLQSKLFERKQTCFLGKIFILTKLHAIHILVKIGCSGKLKTKQKYSTTNYS